MLNYPSISMAEIRRLYNPGEHRHWFDHTTMAFFGTVLPGTGVLTEFGNFFVTRETNPSGQQAFSVRAQDLTSFDIETVGEFHAHRTYDSARCWLRDHLRELAAQGATT